MSYTFQTPKEIEASRSAAGLIQKTYIRICRDSDYTIAPDRAARLTADAIGCHPMDIWFALNWDSMQKIAKGEWNPLGIST